MDVLSLRPTPFDSLTREPDDPRPRWTALRRRIERLLQSMGVDPGQPGNAGLVHTGRARLLAYTSAEIVLGMGLLVIASVTVPVLPNIDPQLGGTALAGPAGGVIVWVLFGLLGSARTTSSRGGGQFTFHMPFVAAAAVLGGPTAGAWVAMLSTIERRELDTQPWYGTLANHAAAVTAAVCAGLVYIVVFQTGVALTGDESVWRFVAILGAALVLETITTMLAAITILIRDGGAPMSLFTEVVRDHGAETALEVGLVWAFVVSYLTVGWWAPVVLATLVIVALSAGRANDRPGPGDVLTARDFERRLGRTLVRRRGRVDRGAILITDINDFGDVPVRFGPGVADRVLATIAERLLAECRAPGDLVCRLVADTFAIYLALPVTDEHALARAGEILAALSQPIATNAGPVYVAASIGVLVPSPADDRLPAAVLVNRAEQAMFVAKRQAGPRGSIHLFEPGDGTRLDDAWRGPDRRDNA